MKQTSLDLLACPQCRQSLDYFSGVDSATQTGALNCPSCQKTFHVRNGIPHFIEAEKLTGLNRRFARMYDLSAWGYRLFSKGAFALIGMKEEDGRREITDRLDPHGGKVLEVSIGPGVNLPYLINRPDIGEIFGLDISFGQLNQCQHYCNRKGWEIELFLGNAEQLPFKDESFSGVFHIGGINFFNDKKAAIEEMIRVAKPGTKILIADETERGAKGYEKTIPGFKESFAKKRNPITPPIELIPTTMLDIHLLDIWKGWFYCIEFQKP